MTVNSRAKGARGERELAMYLRGLGFDARRGQQFAGGEESPDVVWLPEFHVECKRVNRVAMLDWCAQAERDAGCGQVPVVMWRPDREPWRVTLRLDAFATGPRPVPDPNYPR